MSRHRLRWATPADLPQLVDMCAEHAEFEGARFTSEGKCEALAPRMFGSAPTCECIVLEDSHGNLVGYATFAPEWSTFDAAHYLHVDCLYLRPAARSMGAGWLFGKALANEMLTRGYSLMQFQTPTFNEPAIRLYERMGAWRKDKARFFADRPACARFVADRAPIIHGRS